MWSSNPNPKPLNYSLRIAAVVKKKYGITAVGLYALDKYNHKSHFKAQD